MVLKLVNFFSTARNIHSTCRLFVVKYFWSIFILPVLLYPVITPAQKNGIYTVEKRALISTEVDTTLILRYWEQARDIQSKHPDSAITLLKIAGDESKQIAYLYGVARSFAHLGAVYAHTGKYEESIAYLKESIVYAKRSSRRTELLPIIYKDLGSVYVLLGDYEKAAIYSYQAALLAEKAAPSSGKGDILNNLAVILMTLDSSVQTSSGKDGLHYLELAEKYARISGDSSLITTALLNKGGYYLKQSNWVKANTFLQQARQIAWRRHYTEKEHNSLLLMGQLQQGQGKYAEALPWLHCAATLKGNINPYYRVMNQALIGESYFRTGQYDKALHYFQDAASEAQRLGLNYNLMDVHRKLYELFKQKGKLGKALEHYESYIRIKDSIISRTAVQNVQQLEVKYRTVQKDKELLQKQVQIARQTEQLRSKNLWIYIIAGCALLLGVLFLAAYIVFRNRQRLQQQKLHNLQQSYEIGQLKATIEGEEKERNRLARELHNGIGGLLTAVRINYMVLGQKNKSLQETPAYQEVLQMLGTISREVRKTSHNLMPEILLKNSLPEAIQIYCDHIRKDDALQTNIQTFGPFEKLPSDFTLMIYRIIQELVQNVVKHAEATELLIHLLLRDVLISLTVEDNGKGFVVDKQKEDMGLQSLRSVVHSMQGTFSVESNPGNGTSVYLEIPLENYSPRKKT